MVIIHIFMCVLFQGHFPLSICPPDLTIYHPPENGIMMYILYCNLFFHLIYCEHLLVSLLIHLHLYFYGCRAIIQTGCTILTWPLWLHTGCFQCVEGMMPLESVLFLPSSLSPPWLKLALTPVDTWPKLGQLELFPGSWKTRTEESSLGKARNHTAICVKRMASCRIAYGWCTDRSKQEAQRERAPGTRCIKRSRCIFVHTIACCFNPSLYSLRQQIPL